MYLKDPSTRHQLTQTWTLRGMIESSMRVRVIQLSSVFEVALSSTPIFEDSFGSQIRWAIGFNRQLTSTTLQRDIILRIESSTRIRVCWICNACLFLQFLLLEVFLSLTTCFEVVFGANFSWLLWLGAGLTSTTLQRDTHLIRVPVGYVMRACFCKFLWFMFLLLEVFYHWPQVLRSFLGRTFFIECVWLSCWR